VIQLSNEVAEARARRAPIVALETTILTHGMPYPENLATARSVERIIRDGGAVPATIALVRGHIRIGLDDGELERLARAGEVRKLSRADLAYAIAGELDGSTTVAATMICAHLAGIEVFVTGGIGGVHRGVETTLDISADLDELARTPVTVVCSGAKAILDLPKTLEALETRGVPTVVFRSDDFPAFWSRSSGLPAPLRLDTVDAIARLVATKRALGLEGAVLVANPIPAEAEIPANEMRAFVDEALDDARHSAITGKAVTPWLLERLLALTAGRSLRANIALVESNARLGAELARALAAG
jgi:pseudouridine-5'-phosphate glycosidase